MIQYVVLCETAKPFCVSPLNKLLKHIVPQPLDLKGSLSVDGLK